MTLEFVIRLVVAGLLGTLIGLDREYRAKEAGFRTHFLVCTGSALLMIVSQYAFLELHQTEGVSFDSARVAAQVVTGIGFIGAGTIIFQKQIVRGLTTAAGIWVTSAIGLAVGGGMYVLGVSAALLTLVGLELLSFLFKRIGMRSTLIEFSTGHKEVLDRIRERLEQKEYLLVSYQVEQSSASEGKLYQVSMVIKSRKGGEDNFSALFHDFQNEILIYRIE